MDQVVAVSASWKKQFVGVGFPGHGIPLTSVTDAGGRYQLPSNWAGTGPPGGGDAVGVGRGTADVDVGCVAEELERVDALQAVSKTAARTAIEWRGIAAACP